MQNFAHFTDPVQMRPLFQQYLPACTHGNLQITTCQVLHAQYYASIRHPLRSWLGICYGLELTNSARSSTARQILYARARLGGQSQQEYAQAQANPFWPLRIGQPLVHLPALDMTVWGFPNDPQLSHLPQVIDPTLVRAHLPYHALPAGFNTPADLARVDVEVVHYYPEERCTSRYQLWSKQTLQPLLLFGKTFRDDTGHVLFTRLATIAQRAGLEPDHFGVTEPLAYTTASKTLWLQFQPGCPLPKLLNRVNGAALFARIARGLVALQRNALPDLSTVTIAERLDEIHDKARKLAHAAPHWQATLDALLVQLRTASSAFAHAPTTLLHGDFHLRQFLVNGSKLICCDFDELAQGDPLQDVASFLVDLQLTDLAPALKTSLARCFYQSYCQAAPWDTAPARLLWQLRYQFFTKAYRFYRQQRPGWEQPAQTLLEQAQGVTLEELI